MLPPEHPRTAEVLVALATVDLVELRFTQAESRLRSALKWREKYLDVRDPLIAEGVLLLARCRAEQGARAEADSLFTDGIRRLETNRYRGREAESARRELAAWRARW